MTIAKALAMFTATAQGLKELSGRKRIDSALGFSREPRTTMEQGFVVELSNQETPVPL